MGWLIERNVHLLIAWCRLTNGTLQLFYKYSIKWKNRLIKMHLQWLHSIYFVVYPIIQYVSQPIICVWCLIVLFDPSYVASALNHHPLICVMSCCSVMPSDIALPSVVNHYCTICQRASEVTSQHQRFYTWTITNEIFKIV